MRTSLVTGGAGFIGSHLVQALLQRGDQVRVLDNFSTGRAGNLSGLEGSLKVVEGDIRHPAAVASAMQGVDFVFHQAAMVSVPVSMEDPQTCFDVNVSGTLIVLEAARQARVGGVVLASSAAVYGEPKELPLREQVPTSSLSPYAASKRTNEIYAEQYTRAFGLPVTALRYFNVYGPRQSPSSAYAAAIPIFIRRLLDGRPPTIFGDGLQKRDFVYVEDVVRANLAAAESTSGAGQVFNICTGRETSLLDLLSILGQILPGAPAPQFAASRPGDIYRSIGDPSRAAAVLGFEPKVSLQEGLANSVAWMKKTPEDGPVAGGVVVSGKAAK